MAAGGPAMLEEQIDLWRRYLRGRPDAHASDMAALEGRLRGQVAALTDAGLAAEEAFLVAIRRMGDLDPGSREFAREHADRLWKQLVAPPAEGGGAGVDARREAIVAFGLAVVAAVAIKLPEILGLQLSARNLSFAVLPPLVAYFAWKRRPDLRIVGWLAAAFVAAAAAVNAIQFTPRGSTAILTALHLPVMLWLAVGIAHAGGRWRQVAARMDFIRFSGEMFIFFVLIALGGGVFMMSTGMVFQAVGIDIEPFVESWLLPCGAAGAVVVAAWLAETRQGVIGNIAPVLARIFTPLFAVLLVVFLGTLLLTGRGVEIERNLLIAFNLLLALVLGLLLYSISARNPEAAPDAFDLTQVVLVVSALAVDAFALWAMTARAAELGFTPNRTAALGWNVLLLVNLAWSAVLYIRFVRRRGPFPDLERWQMDYLAVYAAWAGIVAFAFPLIFRGI